MAFEFFYACHKSVDILIAYFRNKVRVFSVFFCYGISFLNGPEYKDGCKSTASESDRKHIRLNKLHAELLLQL